MRRILASTGQCVAVVISLCRIVWLCACRLGKWCAGVRASEGGRCANRATYFNRPQQRDVDPFVTAGA